MGVVEIAKEFFDIALCTCRETANILFCSVDFVLANVIVIYATLFNGFKRITLMSYGIVSFQIFTSKEILSIVFDFYAQFLYLVYKLINFVGLSWLDVFKFYADAFKFFFCLVLDACVTVASIMSEWKNLLVFSVARIAKLLYDVMKFEYDTFKDILNILEETYQIVTSLAAGCAHAIATNVKELCKLVANGCSRSINVCLLTCSWAMGALKAIPVAAAYLFTAVVVEPLSYAASHLFVFSTSFLPIILQIKAAIDVFFKDVAYMVAKLIPWTTTTTTANAVSPTSPIRHDEQQQPSPQLPKIDVPPNILTAPQYGKHSYINVQMEGNLEYKSFSQRLRRRPEKTISRVKLHYVECCDDDSKPLMLFLHGFPEFWFAWRYQILHFKKHYRTVAVDLRGFGQSEKPEEMHEYQLKYLVNDVKSLILALGNV